MSTDENPRIGNEIEVYLRRTGRGRKRRPVKQNGIVLEIDSSDHNRVKTHNCPGKFRRVLKINTLRTHHSTSMISNDTQSQSEHAISQYYWDCFYCAHCCG